MKQDRLSMIHAVESRVPFADHRLAEYVFRLPPNYKIHEGIEKIILRESLKEETEFPEEIRNRPKVKFENNNNN